MIQGGDITHGNGQGGFSIYGRYFDDENLALKHKKPYLLSMANKGPDSNGSQFFITCAETPHLDGKHTVFGEVIKGFEIVQKIENLSTGDEDRPHQKVEISHCGEMVRKGDAAEKKSAEPAAEPEHFEPPTKNWLMRASKSPEGRKKRRNNSNERRDRRRHGDRRGKSRSRSRSRSRDREDKKKISVSEQTSEGSETSCVAIKV